ncbi:hybrid sensor histidine kinase/response regulator [Aestuariispira insulae]|uniref:Sensor protein FixL n=1 Tax=Aestuariispira insulae TaxID=1461337 RepID=A0A3D9H599_9PROT|nr:PAS domain S-box protein [Aestuariispira insulae]RED44683.1 PAS domain S-box-containing protein [Aestuariispira insulae]
MHCGFEAGFKKVCVMLSWLRARLLLSLFILFVPVLAGGLTLEYILNEAETAGKTIDYSGRQRMLTTRIDALMTRLAIEQAEADRRAVVSEIKDVADELGHVHDALLNGGGKYDLMASENPKVKEIYFQAPHDLDRRIETYLATIREMIAEGAIDRADIQARLTGLWQERNHLVRALDALTGEFSQENQRLVQGMKRWEWLSLGALLALLLLVWRFSLRPLAERVETEQEALEGISRNVPDGVITIDRHGSIRTFNKAAEEIFGYSEIQVIGQNVKVLMPDPHRSLHDGYLRNRAAGKENKIIGKGSREITGQHSNGAPLPLDLAIGEMMLGGEKVYIGVVRDISARKQMIRDLAAGHEKLVSFVRHTPAAVAMFDRKMRYILHSDRWCRDFGLTDQNIIGQCHYDVLPDMPDEWKESHARGMKGATERCEEDHFIRQNGVDVWLRWEIHPWYESDGAIGGIIMYTEVITERKQAQERLHLLTRAIESASCGIIITDAVSADNGLQYVNPAFERITGYEAAEVLGMNCRFLQGDETDPDMVMVLEKAVKNEEPVKVRLQNYRKDGVPFWNEVSISPVRDSRGRLINFVGVINDVTEQINSVENLRRSEARFRHLYNSTPVMLHSVNEEGRLISVSDYWLRAMGFGREEVLGRRLISFMEQDSAKKAEEEILPRFYQEGYIDDIEYTFLKKDGSAMDVALSAVSDEDEEGNFRSLGVVLDITDKKRVENELLQVQKVEAIGQLTGGIAHDFNNLLAVIMGNLQLIQRRSNDNERVSPLIESALKATGRGADLTRQLLVFARKQQLTPVATDINELVEGLIALFRRTLGEHIEIDTTLCDNAAPILVDQTQLESALLNLAVNARDAMPNGGKLLLSTENTSLDERYAKQHPEVEIGEYILVSVTDNGPGIPKDVQAQIFDPFFTTKDVGKGTGLGLSMVYGFVRQSKGHVRVYSEVNEGTTFQIFLPVNRDATETKVVEEAPERLQGSGQTVLVVEDEPEVRQMHVMLLEDSGFEIIQAANGPEAIEILKSDAAIDILFSDVVMPGGLSGIQLAGEAVKLRPGLPILLASGYPRAAVLEEDAPFELVLKPCPDNLLVSKLLSLLGQSDVEERMEAD